MLRGQTLLIVVLITLAIITLTSITTFHNSTFENVENDEKRCRLPDNDPNSLKLAIFEDRDSHDEVVLAFAHIFSKFKNTKVKIFKDDYRYKMENVLKAFHLEKPQSTNCFFEWAKNEDAKKSIPDIVLCNTCEFNIKTFPNEFRHLLVNTNIHFFCVIHEAEFFLNLGDIHQEAKELLIDFSKAKRMTFLTLSPHVTKYAKDYIKWLVNPRIETIIPVFPTEQSYSRQAKSKVNSDPKNINLAIQGYYQPQRRDYKEIFEQILEYKNAKNEYNLILHLLGSGQHLQVPHGLEDNVIFHDKLTYEEFYTVLSEMFAIIPALTLPDYTINKISSSIPASLLVGVPLIASSPILEAYNFLNATNTWPQADDKSEMDVVIASLQESRQTIEQKREGVKKLAEEIMNTNIELFRGWIAELLPKYSNI